MPQGKKQYYTLPEAAYFLGESLESVQARVERKELPAMDVNGQRMIRGLTLNDFYHDHLRPQRNASKKENNQKGQADRIASVKASGGSRSRSQREAELEAQVKDLHNKLKAQNSKWRSWLERERVEHEKTNRDAQSEISSLDKEVEALKRQLEQEREKADEERAHHLETQQELQELQELKEELEDVRTENNPLKTLWGRFKSAEGRINAELEDESMQTPSSHTGGQTETLQVELVEEKQRREESEKWIRDLQSERESLQAELEKEHTLRKSSEKQLQASKAEQEEYVQKLLNSKEQALEQAREQASRYENEKDLLDEIRRLLGNQPASEAYRPTHSTEDGSTEDEGYLLDTPYGQYRFVPPFLLEDNDLELLRLVAMHGELTAGQIRKQTGRRRAVGDLDDLLDSLEERGVVIIEVVENRYRLDVTKLHSD